FIYGIALFQLFDSRIRPALLSVLVMGMLPGALYYGKVLDTTIFGVTAMLIVFSCWIFYLKSEAPHKNRFFLILMLAILTTSLTNWYIYFLTAALWLFLWIPAVGRRVDRRNKLLIALPVVSGLAVGLNLIHFYWQNGSAFLPQMLASYSNRSS